VWPAKARNQFCFIEIEKDEHQEPKGGLRDVPLLNDESRFRSIWRRIVRVKWVRFGISPMCFKNLPGLVSCDPVLLKDLVFNLRGDVKDGGGLVHILPRNPKLVPQYFSAATLNS
jgi:hypothetical protein